MGGWNKQKPSTPGAYYVRGYDLDHPATHALVEVMLDNDSELRCNLHESNSAEIDDEFSDWSHMDDMSDGFEWIGPLVPPNNQAHLRERSAAK